MDPSDLFGLQAVLDGAEPWCICTGDCVDLMLALPDDSVDAVVCDPPYGLEFMGKEWDRLGAPEGFRRTDNPNDVGRDSIHGRMSRTSPEYTTGAGRTSKPGIGERQTEWPSNRGWNEWRCAECGHLMHGGSPCRCEHPRPVRQDDRWNLMQDWHLRWAKEAFRVLKPGGHLIAFGGTRTYHRLVCALEDVGFEIRDMLAWNYGQGFPKSLDVSKALDKAVGAKRKVVGYKESATYPDSDGTAYYTNRKKSIGSQVATGGMPELTIPSTAAACQWNGWGTALKPAHEPIVLARKPLSEKNVAANVLKWGTGCLNIDGCRIGTGDSPTGGRWPANIILTHHPLCTKVGERKVKARVINRFTDGAKPFGGGAEHPYETVQTSEDGLEEIEVWACVPGCPVRMLDIQSKPSVSRKGKPRESKESGEGWGMTHTGTEYEDAGGPSRFFYTAKASRSEREAGLDSQEIVTVEYETWGREVRKARLRVDTAPSPPRVIGVSGTPDNDATVWNTFLFGSDTTAPSLLDTPSIIATATNWITESRILNWLAHLLTNASIVVQNGETVSGGSHAESAVRSTPLLIITSGRMASPRGADVVASAMRWIISGNVGSPSDHPTVKPVDLMRYLCRLVTPPGGLVLDPFAGSGTTGIACALESYRFVGFEQEPGYVEIARARIQHWARQDTQTELPMVK